MRSIILTLTLALLSQLHPLAAQQEASPQPASPLSEPVEAQVQGAEPIAAETGEEARGQDEVPGGVIRSAHYSAVAGDVKGREVLKIEGTIMAESLVDGRTSIPLGDTNLSVTEIRSGDARLHRNGENYELILPQGGEYAVEFSLVAPVRKDEGGKWVELDFFDTPLSQVTLSTPGTDRRFEMPDEVVWSSESAADQTRLTFNLTGSDEVAVHWSAPPAPGQEPEFIARTSVNTRVSPGSVQTHAEINYQIFRSGMETFIVHLSPGHRVAEVHGDEIQEWDLSPAEGHQTLTVHLKRPVTDDYYLALQLEAPLASLPETIAAPSVQTPGAKNQSGTLEVSASREVDVSVSNVMGMSQEQADARQGNQVVGVYRYVEPPYQADLHVEEIVTVVHVESRAQVTVEPDAIQLSAHLDYQIRRIGIREAVLEIPPGYGQWMVEGSYIDSFNAEDGKLRIRFDRSMETGLQLELTARKERSPQDRQVTVPTINPLGVERHTARVEVAIAESLTAELVDGGGLTRVAPETSRQQAETDTIFKYEGDAEPATFAISPKVPRISGEVYTLVKVGDEAIHYRWLVEYRVREAGVDRLTLRVPRYIADQLRVQSDGLKIERGEPAEPGQAGNGNEVEWTILLPEKQMGAVQLELSMERPTQPLKAGEALNVELPEIMLADAVDQYGELAVAGGRGLEVTDLQVEEAAAAVVTELGPVTVFEEEENVLRSWSFRESPGRIAFTLTRREVVEKAPALAIASSQIATVVAADGHMLTEIVAWLRNQGEDSLRVRLPNSATLVSDVLVGGETLEPTRISGGAEIRIPLPREAPAGGELLPVRLIYEVPGEMPLAERSGFVVPTPAFMNAEVLQSRLDLYLPDQYFCRGLDSEMESPPQVTPWEQAREKLSFLIPSLLQPSLGAEPAGVASAGWQEPPSLTKEAAGSMVPLVRQGRLYQMHRLGQAAPVRVEYLERSLALTMEAVLALVAFGFGLMLTRAAFGAKVFYLLVAGIVPLIVAGVTNPQLAPFWVAIYLGVVCAVVFWILHGIWWAISAPARKQAASAAETAPPTNGHGPSLWQSGILSEKPTPVTGPVFIPPPGWRASGRGPAAAPEAEGTPDMVFPSPDDPEASNHHADRAAPAEDPSKTQPITLDLPSSSGEADDGEQSSGKDS